VPQLPRLARLVRVHRSLAAAAALLLLLLAASVAAAGGDGWVALGPDGPSSGTLVADQSTAGSVYLLSGKTLYHSADSGGTWEFAGGGLSDTYRIDQLVSDPQTPGTVYAGGAPGLRKSTNWGRTWQTLDLGDAAANAAEVPLVTVDPSTPGTVYAFLTTPGIYKSSDGGETWRKTSGGLPAEPGGASELFFSALAVDPAATANVYVAHNATVYRSPDGGATWTAQGSVAGAVNRLTFEPGDPSVLVSWGSGGVERSTDLGRTWSRSAGGGAVALDWRVPGLMYGGVSAEIHGGPRDGSFSLIRSTDGGATWTIGERVFPPYLRSLAFDPHDPDTVYLTTADRLFVSRDAAATFVERQLPKTAEVGGLAIDPGAPRTVYASTRGGLFKSVDAGGAWTRLAPSLRPLMMPSAGVAVDASDSDRVLLATDGGVAATEDGGATWRLAGPYPGAGSTLSVAFAPSAPQTVYASSGGRVYASVDGGATWGGGAAAGPNDSFGPTRMAVDPGDPRTVYSGSSLGGVWKFTDGAQTAEQILQVPPDTLGPFALHAFAAGPARSGVVYAEFSTIRGPVIATNGTRGGEPVACTPPIVSTRFSDFTSLAVAADGTIYLGSPRGVYASDDCLEWRLLPGSPEDTTILAFDPVRASTVYAGTSSRGVLRLGDASPNPPRAPEPATPPAAGPGPVDPGTPVVITMPVSSPGAGLPRVSLLPVRPPVVVSASVRSVPAPRAARFEAAVAWRYLLRTRVRRGAARVVRVQIAARRGRPGAWRAYRPSLLVRASGPPQWVRVEDAAGQRSGWRRIAGAVPSQAPRR
jgi:photosystem II stability/assembly factor-like uncharacterized protein